MSARPPLCLVIIATLALPACASGGAPDMPSLRPLPNVETPDAASRIGSDVAVSATAARPSAALQETPEFSTASIATGGGAPSSAEIAYADATAAGVFRRRRAERATTFLSVGTVDGYGLCLRSPARKGAGYDYVLILMPQRLSGGPISQVDDETLVMRRPADAAPCRAARLSWVTTT